VNLTDTEKKNMQKRQRMEPWFPEELNPFQIDEQSEPLNSLGLRRNGEVVGWIITHRLATELIQYTSFFAQDGVPRVAALTMLAKAIRLQEAAGVPNFACMTRATNSRFLRFYGRRFASYEVDRAETRLSGTYLTKSGSRPINYAV